VDPSNLDPSNLDPSDIDLRDLDRQGGEWLRGSGPRSEIVISSRVRLARNLAGFPFLSRATEDQRREIVARVRGPLERLQLKSRPFYVDMDRAGDMLGSFLVERHLISGGLLQGSGPRGVAFGSDEVVSVMINEEDHVRIQAIQSSLSLSETFHVARAIDLKLEQELEFAASADFGYLTACPTNVGTGMRASVMLHLPAMVQMKQIEKLFHAAKDTSLAVRGFYGEGTVASGDLYQISNQVTLGVTEEEVLQSLDQIIPTILDYERTCREELVSERRRLAVEDRCHRSLSLLQSARILSSEEAMENLSTVRLGIVTGILSGVDLAGVNELFVLTQPAHIQKLRGTTIDVLERDAARARFVRERLA
jgi:protein arginine kinase